jgi:CheY-like chemotaxis protein
MTVKSPNMPIRQFTEDFSRDRPRFHGSPVILVVEDHADTREMLRVLLEMRGCRVVEAEDGESAVAAAVAAAPDLILMDTWLPGLSGLAAVGRIREKQSLRNVPIIAVTGYATEQFRAQTLAAGCDECLVKPFDFERFDRLILHFLGGKVGNADPSRKYALMLRSSGHLNSQSSINHRAVG